MTDLSGWERSIPYSHPQGEENIIIVFKITINILPFLK
jgi:hypothetical protein